MDKYYFYMYLMVIHGEHVCGACVCHGVGCYGDIIRDLSRKNELSRSRGERNSEAKSRGHLCQILSLLES